MIFATVVPFGDVADEAAQSLRAEALLGGVLVGHRVSVMAGGEQHLQAGVSADPALVFAALTPHDGKMVASAAALTKAHQQVWTGTAPFMAISPLAVYAPLFYIPGAAGIGLGRGLGLSPYHTGMLARLVNALAYLGIGLLALALAGRARAALFGVLIVPMSLNLAASLSQDGLIIATSVLAAACLTRCLANPAAWGFRLAAAGALGCVALVKPPYVILALGLLLPLRGMTRRDFAGRAALIAAVGLPVMVWFGWTMLHVSAPTYFPPRPAGPLLPGGGMLDHTDPAAQIHILLAAPWLMVWLPVHTFWLNPLLPEMVGVLGWLDLVLPGWFYHFWYAIAGLAVLAALSVGRSAPAAGWRDFGLMLVAVFGTFLAIYLSQYLVWSTPGAVFIEGPQGRYLLPLVPFAAAALPGLRLPPALAGIGAAAVVAGAVIGLCVLPYLLATSYYVN